MKKILISIICIITLFSSISYVSAKKITIDSDYAIVLDPSNNQVLYEKNGYEKMYPASMTKLVTVYLALKQIKDVNDSVVIQPYDLETLVETNASVANFELNEKTTYLDLLYGAMLPSGADATRALARLTSGSIEAFVDDMNEWTKEMGFTHTHFANPTGIHDDNHYTTAYEMAMITKIVLEDSQFRTIFTTKKWTSQNKKHTWSANMLVIAEAYGLNVDFILGSKTGYTLEAELCLASLIQVGEKELIVIVGHGNKDEKDTPIKDTTILKQYFEDTYDVVTVKKKDQILDSLSFNNTPKTLDIKLENDIMIYLPKDYQKNDIEFRYHYDIDQAPIKRDSKIGSIEVIYQDAVIYKQDLISNQEIKEDLLGYYLMYFFQYLPYLIVVVVILIAVLIISKKSKRRKRK